MSGQGLGRTGLGIDSNKIAERYEAGGPNPGFIDALNALSGGNVIPLRGGLLIHDPEGVLIGAVGVSGALPEQDEECARPDWGRWGWRGHDAAGSVQIVRSL